MTAPDPRERGLDPAHILSVINQAAQDRPGQAALAVAAPDGVRVCLRSRRAASNASAALIRVGYQAARIGDTSRRDLVVTGWSAAGLESRLTAMRAVLYQLNDSPAVTAVAVIERFRRLPATSPAGPGTSLLAEARGQLVAWVSGRSGIHAPHNPAILPADVGNALRLRAAWALENAIDDLIERHLRVAGHALPLFQSLRLRVTEDHAKDTAIRWASVTYHLSASTGQDTGVPGRWPGRPRGPDPRPSEPAPGSGAASAPARQDVPGFLRLVTSAEAADPITVTARPRGRHRSARRSGPSR